MAFSTLTVVPGNFVSTFPAPSEVVCIKVPQILDAQHLVRWRTALLPWPAEHAATLADGDITASVRRVEFYGAGRCESVDAQRVFSCGVRPVIVVDLVGETRHRLSCSLPFLATIPIHTRTGAAIRCRMTRHACRASRTNGAIHLAVGLELVFESVVEARVLVPSFGSLKPATCGTADRCRLDPAGVDLLRRGSLAPPPLVVA